MGKKSELGVGKNNKIKVNAEILWLARIVIAKRPGEPCNML